MVAAKDKKARGLAARANTAAGISAAGGALAPFNNAVGVIGDSKVGNGYPGYSIPNGRSYLQWGALLSGGRFWGAMGGGVGGYRTDQVEDIILPTVLAGQGGGMAWSPGSFVKPGYLVVDAGTNDIGQSVAIPTIIANLDRMYGKILAAGIIPVAVMIPPRGDKLLNVNTFNAAVAKLAQQRKIPLFNMHKAVVDPLTGYTKAAYCGRLSSLALGNNPFATTNGSSTVVVTQAVHNITSGKSIYIRGATAVGGLTITGAYKVTVIDGNSYSLDAGSNASSTATGGGASVLLYPEDSLHMNAIGNMAAGAELAATLNFLPATLPKLMNDATLWVNGLFLTDATSDGFPDGWADFLGGNVTSSITTDSEVSGKVCRLTCTVEAGGTLRTPITQTVADNWYVFSYRAKFTKAGATPQFAGFLRQYQGAAYLMSGFSPSAGATPNVNDGDFPSTGQWVDYYGIFQMPAHASVTGSISGTTLTVTAVAYGAISVGQRITGVAGVTDCTISAILTGSGGVGTYTVSVSQTVTSRAIKTSGNAWGEFNVKGLGSVLDLAQVGMFNLTAAGLTP